MGKSKLAAFGLTFAVLAAAQAPPAVAPAGAFDDIVARVKKSAGRVQSLSGEPASMLRDPNRVMVEVLPAPSL